jgi:uncharacterized protein YyaL (SSP411 family)
MNPSPQVAEKMPNRLIHEKSPYLLQHAYNPVDWFPWGAEAFKKAHAKDKPVFVSIGYSSCHWCHVMEKESFEDPQVAEALNKAFICVKVDREERPDLDAAYMAVCQAMGRNCGWPLNVIMTPDKKPFFVASYIPKDNRYGTVGLLSLAPQISEIWRTRRTELESVGEEVTQQVALKPAAPSHVLLDKSDLDNAYEQLFLRFDPDNGGFGIAPKFPAPQNLMFLLRYWRRTGEKSAWNMVEKTLRAMRLGGIFDQVGLGFHRYSTDSMWLVPHFEKMLYDQATQTIAYLEAYQASGAKKFKITSMETLEYVLRDLKTPEGAFYAAEDADSEGKEGKFYLWTLKEIQQALQPPDAELAIKLFNVKARGNFSEVPKNDAGNNILYFGQPIEDLASETGLTSDELIVRLGKITHQLYLAREKRVHPNKDDKILVDWNGLMIAALARASQVLRQPRYLQTAKATADFLLKELRTPEGRLLHRYAKGEAAVGGFLDDYACLCYGLIEMYEAGFEEKYLQASIELTNIMLEEFWDPENGGFFLTDQTAEASVPRIKQTYDGAAPSGNSIALLNLLRLAAITGEVRFEEYAEKLFGALAEEVKGQPLGHTFLLVGLDFALEPLNVVLVGDCGESDLDAMLGVLREKFLPNLVVVLWTPERAKAAPLGVRYVRLEGKVTAFVCRGETCLPPTNAVEGLMKQLGVDG